MPTATTGMALLADVGSLAYNGVTFTCLYESMIAGKIVPDSSGRATKLIDYLITVDSLVCLPDRNTITIDKQMVILRQKLTQPAGVLTYQNKGFGSNLQVNPTNAVTNTPRDLAWGPFPELLEFKPLGGSKSAMVKWQVHFRTNEQPTSAAALPLLQFCYSNVIAYDESGYSNLTINGIFEIAMTRQGSQDNYNLTSTVDNYREDVLSRVTDGLDLATFKVSKRSFEVSEDKRTCSFSFNLKELPPMGNPAGVFSAKGEFSFKPSSVHRFLISTVRWTCNLRGTYKVPPPYPRRTAWIAFVSMWRFRMIQSQLGGIDANGNIATPPVGAAGAVALNLDPRPVLDSQFLRSLLRFYNDTGISSVFRGHFQPGAGGGSVAFNSNLQRAMPTKLMGYEGLYEDSDTVSFEAEWILLSSLERILLSTGMWRWSGVEGGELYASSIRGLSGARSWLKNELDPSAAAIVDFGHPGG